VHHPSRLLLDPPLAAIVRAMNSCYRMCIQTDCLAREAPTSHSGKDLEDLVGAIGT